MADATTMSSRLTLQDVIRTIPRDCFQPHPGRALGLVTLSLSTTALAYAWLIWNPIGWLLPLAWVFAGTSLTGWFVIAHDCGHRSFSKSTRLNNWLGSLLMLPLLYPFHAWRLGHDHHHRFTNQMQEDNAWRPFRPSEYTCASRGMQVFYRGLRSYFWWVASIAHWAVVHFGLSPVPSHLSAHERQAWRFSVGLVLGFGLIALPSLTYFLGIWGLVKFWVMPWLVYHFWMSTFTLFHHTHPHIPFHEAEAWDPVQAQLSGTVHCQYPFWVEWLCHDINVHIPHHLSTAIPSYHLRRADRALQARFADRMTRTHFNWTLIRSVVQTCHLYDTVRPYLSFRQYHRHSS
ncbi:MAG: fatty acid desaturase [Cyanobacteriota bacterium]|nr:fatty acid desaturase [Cyanobacteriota bacterium]